MLICDSGFSSLAETLEAGPGMLLSGFFTDHSGLKERQCVCQCDSVTYVYVCRGQRTAGVLLY